MPICYNITKIVIIGGENVNQEQIDKITHLFNTVKELESSTNFDYFAWKDAREELMNYATELRESGIMTEEQYNELLKQCLLI